MKNYFFSLFPMVVFYFINWCSYSFLFLFSIFWFKEDYCFFFYFTFESYSCFYLFFEFYWSVIWDYYFYFSWFLFCRFIFIFLSFNPSSTTVYSSTQHSIFLLQLNVFLSLLTSCNFGGCSKNDVWGRIRVKCIVHL